MTHHITRAIDSLTCDLHDSLHPSVIQQICIDVGYRWRTRTLDPVRTIWLFALQILHFNTSCMAVVRQASAWCTFTDTAYGQARDRLPLQVFQRLFAQVACTLRSSTDVALDRWRGHRVYHVDGSSVRMPDTASLRDHFGQPAGKPEGCGFPVATLVGLFQAGSGLLVDWLIEPLYSHEAPLASRLFRHLAHGDVLVGDRAFCSFVLLALLQRRGIHGIMRQHQRRPRDFRRGRYLARNERLITWRKPLQRPRWIDPETFAALPDTLTLRQIRYQLKSNGFRPEQIVLVTTLVDPETYPADEIAMHYADRWSVETCYRHLKSTMRMDSVRCKTPTRVEKELWMFGLVYNLVRAVMVQAGIRQQVDPDRISFIDVLRWLTLRPNNPEGIALPRFVVNPKRTTKRRAQPRAVKQPRNKYPRLNHPRASMCTIMKA